MQFNSGHRYPLSLQGHISCSLKLCTVVQARCTVTRGAGGQILTQRADVPNRPSLLTSAYACTRPSTTLCCLGMQSRITHHNNKQQQQGSLPPPLHGKETSHLCSITCTIWRLCQITFRQAAYGTKLPSDTFSFYLFNFYHTNVTLFLHCMCMV
jgi:hypothetical protein